ncbi:MAG: YceI family protein [Myxococcota bacterium]
MTGLADSRFLFRHRWRTWGVGARLLALALVAAMLVVGCKRKTETTPIAPGSAPLPSAVPAPSTHFVIETAGSSITFEMDSPLEKIRGELKDGLRGDLDVNLADVENSSGSVEVDLEKLALFRQKRKDEKHSFSESSPDAQQNREAREWLQLEAREGEIADEQAKRNRFPKFSLDRLDSPSAKNIQALSGSERHVGAVARGSLVLHGRTNKKSVKLALTFVYAGERVESIRVQTSEPLAVDLDEYDVHPRNRVGKQIKTIQEALAGEYAKRLQGQVRLNIAFTAKPR